MRQFKIDLWTTPGASRGVGSSWRRNWQLTVAAALCSFASIGTAAEFDDDDVLPIVASIAFSANAISLHVESASYLNLDDTYFVADRSDHSFRRVSEEAYRDSLGNVYSMRRFLSDPYERTISRSYALDGRQVRVDKAEDACERGQETISQVIHGDFTTSVELVCGAHIVDAVRNGESLWLAVFGAPHTYEFRDRGVVVTSMEGNVEARVIVGKYPIMGLALDPWTNEIWVISQDRLTRVTENYRTVARYWPHHDFDERMKRPHTFVTAAPDRIDSAPLTLIAYGLGQPYYERFFDIANELPDLSGQGIMYSYAMNGPDYLHQPLLPKELNVLIDDAQPNASWRRFLCLLDDDKAKELCLSDPERWSREVD